MPKATKIRVGDDRKVIHPNSRKAAQIARAAHHDTKVQRKRHAGNMKLGLQGEKIMWFKDHLIEGKNDYCNDDVCSLIDGYLHRFDEELEQINIVNNMKGRKGQQHVPRLDSIKFILEKDEREFNESGFEIPDLFDEENLEYISEADVKPDQSLSTNEQQKTIISVTGRAMLDGPGMVN